MLNKEFFSNSSMSATNSNGISNGKSKISLASLVLVISLIIVFLSTLVQITFRVSSAYIIIPKIGVEGGAYATLIGWIAMISFELPILIYFWKKNIKLEEKDEEIITI